ncbi:ABC transporter ATP-binding protein [Massilia eurypsychrophila]|uniref:ABC transporter ATP-binding protein n=1 Tax=Massilia eurypsychrophila TaxID=1485217 RepID=A0A2G8TH58_9BURK|nr:ABC transporter ATP-binding protein [Massilia eurypsychrophila]PIL45365.1 ABC transporter ATP-binding protein [Massilia eurypsychrophila]
MTVPIIQIASISKQFTSKPVLDQLDWEILPGQVIGLLGRKGAGKSTLLACMLGLQETDGGAVSVFGEPAANLSPQARAKVAYVPHTCDLFEWLSPLQMLDYFKTLYPHWNSAKVEGLLARWGFDKIMRKRPISQLSAVEKQRLSIVRALAHDPQLLVLDEPMSALEPAARRDFLRELFDGFIERGTTIVFSTHVLSDLERVASEVAFLKTGKIALQGGLDELLQSARRVTGPGRLLDRFAVSGELRRSKDLDGITQIVTSAASGELLALAEREPAIRIEHLTLADLFVEVTQ